MMNYMNGMMNYIDRKVRKRFLRLFFLSAPLLLLATACSQEEVLEESSATPVTLQISAAIEGETRAAEKTAFEEWDIISVYLSTDTNEETPYQYVCTEDGSWVSIGDNKLTLTKKEVKVYAKYRGESLTFTYTGNDSGKDYISSEVLKSEEVTVSLSAPRANFFVNPTQYMLKMSFSTLGAEVNGTPFEGTCGDYSFSGRIEDSAITFFFEKNFEMGGNLDITVHGEDDDYEFVIDRGLFLFSPSQMGHAFIFNVILPNFMYPTFGNVKKYDIAMSNGRYARIFTEDEYTGEITIDQTKVDALKTYLIYHSDISIKGVVFYAKDGEAYMISLNDYTEDESVDYGYTYNQAMEIVDKCNQDGNTSLWHFLKHREVECLFDDNNPININKILKALGGDNSPLVGKYWVNWTEGPAMLFINQMDENMDYFIDDLASDYNSLYFKVRLVQDVF
jgi:hypothetical protein